MTLNMVNQNEILMSGCNEKKNNIVGVIPARYGSTRLPGKPLLMICGKPMIWWVYMSAKKVKEFNKVIVATDDRRIEEYCMENGIDVIMTEMVHITAANRLYEVSTKVDADFYVQINGDEPLISHSIIKKIIPNCIPQEYEYGVNLITKINHSEEIMDTSNIKIVFDYDMNAVYMSRNPIPYFKNENEISYYKHLGVIGYNKKMLEFYANSTPGYLEKKECIDTLRFLDYRKILKVKEVDSYESLSVDTIEDLCEVEKRMKQLINVGRK